MKLKILAMAGLAAWLNLADLLAAHPATEGSYLALTARHRTPATLESLRLTRGPVERVGRLTAGWWQMELRSRARYEEPPLCIVRWLAVGEPLPRSNTCVILRYQLRVPATGECYEYAERFSGLALLPAWANFQRHFLPHASPGSGAQHGLPESVELLGQVWTMHYGRTNAPWAPWADARQLVLDRELLVGNSRPFKDREERRLPQTPQRQDYHYVPYTEADIRAMIGAGFNLFTVQPAQEAWVRGEPVFYHRSPPLQFPTDLYRANYLGPVMFMDEPSILMVGDTNVHRTLRYFADAAALIEKRTRATFEGAGPYGSWHLHQALENAGINLGDLRVQQVDYPSWETLHETTFYQMRGGGAGLVHEGRYQLPEFDRAVQRFTGRPRAHTPRELLEYHYAFLRGGTLPLGKHWGTAIYGQCDTNIAPLALTLAYDRGARYLWFWSSDHDHHVPWPEQLALARHLRAHEQAHPRGSIFHRPPPAQVAIAIPEGYFLSLDNLWWVRVLDREGKNEASQRYQRLMRRALLAMQECWDRGRTFDVVVDDGRAPRLYPKVIRIHDAP
ncbi:hypothetical protein NXS98_12420 [Fontisphaera persica]|uniref:hypothetical protein n=1 Tax=Fontisphaera persica TaxID=2974023 RepID=UPI0024C0CE19|nr:hypothetical protein [Fontisphaera persica]WCJ58521.1 hypothetical protein NXS98_12420 [Fontisphaera persica]